jgi:DNA-binding CsgD family transcriptional regulator
MTDDTNETAAHLAVGTLSLAFLDSLSAGFAAHYAVTSQVQWVTFHSGEGLEQAAAAVKPAADAAQCGAADREAASVSGRGLKKPITSKPASERSEREKACLSWTALGKSSWEIGRILAISENTVVFHIKNAMKKLDAHTRMVAAVKAILLGLIALPIEDDHRGAGRATRE